MPSLQTRIGPRSYTELTGSHKDAPEGTKVRRVALNKMIDFSVQFQSLASQAEIDQHKADVKARRRSPLSRAEVTELLNGKTEDIAAFTAEATKLGLTAIEPDAADLMLGIRRFKGTYARVRELFPELDLWVWKASNPSHGELEFIGRDGPINIWDHYQGAVTLIAGLDERPVADTNTVRFRPGMVKSHAINGLTSRGIARKQGVPVDDLLKNVPAGMCTAFISLSNSNPKRLQTQLQSDVNVMAKAEGVQAAQVIVIPVRGYNPKGFDWDSYVEDALDAQAHAALNPRGIILVFLCSNDDDSFAAGHEAAVAYTLQKIKCISISWGGPAVSFTAQTQSRWKRSVDAGILMGVFTTAATGDNGSKDGTQSDTPDAPSIIPGIIGCGGTDEDATVGSGLINVIRTWNDMAEGGGAGGGGVDDKVWPKQDFEANTKTPPNAESGKLGHATSQIGDIAAPKCGPDVFVRGVRQKVGGTSHASPFGAIKLALINCLLEHPITDMNGFIYDHQDKGLFLQVTESGTNGDYSANPGDVYNVPLGFGRMAFNPFLAYAKHVQDGLPLAA
jgi:kumamolisin